ncbi:MAG: HlyD family secretion protein [Rhizobiales bacterium]|nr:HlyD family secretion protein [Hyphomicrobiales bacterium]
MAEQPLSSDHEAASVLSAPAQRAPPDMPRGRRRLWSWITIVRLAVLLAAGVIVVLFATQWDRWVGLSVRQVTDDAYVRGDITPLSAHIEGYVRRVPVDDFQRVKEGEVLVEIEDDDYRARAAQAEADLLGAQAAIENLKARKEAQHAQVAEAEDAINATQADVERTRLEAERQRALLATTFGTRQRVEQADAEAQRFAATLSRNQADLEAQRSQMAVLDTQEAQLRADLKAKQAALDLARINLGYTRIAAPVAGMVSERGVRAGQYVHAGTQVIAVVPDNVWVVANYKETQLTHVAIGQRAEIRVDTFPGVAINARVDSIAPASGAQFSLLPPDNATGNFTKVVQRIPVKLRIAPDNPLAGKLRPGMSVIATILTDTTPPPP